MHLKQRKFKATKTHPVDEPRTRKPDTAWHDARYQEAERGRVAARSTRERVDAQLRSSRPVVDGERRETWGLDDGKVVVQWRQRMRTTLGRIPVLRSLIRR